MKEERVHAASTATYESPSRPCLFDGLLDGDPGLSGYCESEVAKSLAGPDMSFLRALAQPQQSWNAVWTGIIKATVEMVQQAMANHPIPVCGHSKRRIVCVCVYVCVFVCDRVRKWEGAHGGGGTRSHPRTRQPHICAMLCMPTVSRRVALRHTERGESSFGVTWAQ